MLNEFDRIIIILGAGLDKIDGQLSENAKRRCDLALQLFNSNDLVITISLFSLNVPTKIDFNGYVRSEATEMYRYLQTRISAKNIISEQFSRDSMGCLVFFIC